VTIVTVRRRAALVTESAPERDGFTATAFLTVSMTPPIIAVSATNASSALTMLRDAESFAVSLLAADQKAIANAFAKPAAQRAGIWQEVPWSADLEGAPLIEGACGAYSARVHQLVEAGDHTLVLGAVTAIHVSESADSLLYHNRSYGRVLAEK
jgi:3-hydroxy-9,10-secoandrosta-1,3,5(10)-triene-9,17-dione monooxygenase reductase component